MSVSMPEQMMKSQDIEIIGEHADATIQVLTIYERSKLYSALYHYIINQNDSENTPEVIERKINELIDSRNFDKFVLKRHGLITSGSHDVIIPLSALLNGV